MRFIVGATALVAFVLFFIGSFVSMTAPMFMAVYAI